MLPLKPQLLEHMRAEKLHLTAEYKARLNQSPFFIVVDYQGLKVRAITELRKRLAKAGAEMHVVKNTIFRLAAKEAGVTDLDGGMAGQMAVITGQKDVSTAAKAVKTFQAEFDRPKIKFGYLNNQRMESAEVLRLADLPSLDVLRAQLLGTIMMPATQLVRMITTPGTQLARVLQAKVDKQGAGGEAKAE
jgi:large subunit ribosomal protein L10